jgi:hypothetical protein
MHEDHNAEAPPDEPPAPRRRQGDVVLEALLLRYDQDQIAAAARHSAEDRYRDEQRDTTRRLELQLAELGQAVKAGARVGTFLAALVLILVLLLAQSRGLDAGKAAEAAGALVGGMGR